MAPSVPCRLSGASVRGLAVDIALVTPGLSGGGSEKILGNLCRELVSLGYRVDVLVLTGARTERSADGNPRIISFGSPKVSRSLLSIIRYLRNHRPAVVMGSMAYVNIVLLLAVWLSRTGSRCVLREATTPSSYLATIAPLKRMIFRSVMKHAYNRADKVVAVSQGAARDLARSLGVKPERIVQIYNPAVGPDIRRVAEEEVSLSWYRDKSVPIVVSVGRLDAGKDQATLVQAFSLLRKRRPARLVLIGDGPSRPHLEKLVEDLGLSDEVHFAGYQENPYKFIKGAGVLALSSRYEGLPNVLIESLFLGTPVVSTNCPSGPEEILEGGEHGRLVPIGDSRALCDALEQTLEDPVPEERLVAATRRFDVRDRTLEYLEVLLPGDR